MSRILIALSINACLVLSAHAYPPAPIYDSSHMPAQKYVGRSVQRLQEGKSLKILFFGQSHITCWNEWPHVLVEVLRRRFPESDISYENAAIGGCFDMVWVNAENGTRLSTALSGRKPDLVITNVGGSDRGFRKMFTMIRKLLPEYTEFVTFNIHAQGIWAEKRKDDQWWSTQFFVFSDEYKMGAIDSRGYFRKYAEATRGDPVAFEGLTVSMEDGHLRDEGGWVYVNAFLGFFLKDQSVNPAKGISVPAEHISASRPAPGQENVAFYLSGKESAFLRFELSHLTQPITTAHLLVTSKKKDVRHNNDPTVWTEPPNYMDRNLIVHRADNSGSEKGDVIASANMNGRITSFVDVTQYVKAQADRKVSVIIHYDITGRAEPFYSHGSLPPLLLINKDYVRDKAIADPESVQEAARK